MGQEHDEDEGSSIEYTAIVVGENPIVVYDWRGAHSQNTFLNGIDPSFFRYLAGVHGAQLESDSDRYAAVALRITYSHALETLFALIGAAVQAPHCPAGWVLNYKASDLRTLVGAITRRESIISTTVPQRADWGQVADAIIPTIPDTVDPQSLRAASGKLWASLARDIEDANLNDEYNSLKHGFRVRSGDWFFKIGVEDSLGVSPPPDRMRLMGSSRYGSSFLRSVPLAKYQQALEEQRVNWNPTLLSRRILLIADSVHNVLTFLKLQVMEPTEELTLLVFSADDVSDALYDPKPSGVSRWSMRPRIPVELLPMLSRDDILAWYSEKHDSDIDVAHGH